MEPYMPCAASEFILAEDIKAVVEIYLTPAGTYWFKYWEIHSIHTGWYGDENTVIERQYVSDNYLDLGVCVEWAMDLVFLSIQQSSVPTI